jgi:hypothetical protein
MNTGVVMTETTRLPKPFTACMVAEVLGEQDAEPCRQIANIVLVFGRFGAWRLLGKTLDMEQRGGLLVTKGTRRRTPGGTFFSLARQWCRSVDEQQRIFGDVKMTLRNGHMRTLEAAKTAQTPRPVLTVQQTLKELPQLPREGARVKLTLIGRPQRLVNRETYVVFPLAGTPPPSLPKGLPKPPQTTLSWVVMVGKKQWAKVAESLASDLTTKLIVEGYPCLQGTTHVLLTTMGTTTTLQRARAEAAAAAVGHNT